MSLWSRVTHLLLAMLLASSTVARAGGAYVDNQDATITDTQHGLMWQKSDDGVERSWQESIAYCEALELAGHKDWTLPKASQLEGLIDTAFSPTIDPLFSVKPSYYWSATESTSSANSARYVNFYYGNTYTYSKDNPYYAICVREAGASSSRGLTAVFAGAPVAGKPLTIRFTATISGGSEPYFSEWDFGDGATASATNPSHDFAKEGHYKVLLTVSDNDGAVSVATQEITLPLAEPPAGGGGEDQPALAPPAEGTVPVLTEQVVKKEGATPEAAGVEVEKPIASPSTEVRPQAEEEGPVKAKGPRGVMEVMGSGQGAPYKGGALGHGLLAYTLANAMAGDGDRDKDGTVTAGEIQAYLGQAIKSLSKGGQAPEITRDGDDFPICAPSPGSTYVMAIGIAHDLADAPLIARQDAELVRKAVEEKCSRTKTMMLTADHANRQDILQALLQIGSMITKDDTLLVYVGGASGLDNGRLNWYVNNTSKELPSFTGIYHDDLVQFLKTMPVDHLVVLGEKN